MSTITELRLQLLANGYSPIRNRDKRTFMPGWPTVELTPAEIEMWGRKHKRDTATGLRVENGLAVIDFDINDKTAMNLIADRVFEAIPELGDPNANLLVRTGKGAKEAWFVRTDEEFGRIHSRSYTRPGEGVDDGTHRVEIFGGSSARQFGAFGAHTITDDGVVAVSYAWPEQSPETVRQSELPELTKQQFFQIADIAEATLKELGWSAVERSSKGENDAVRVYDLTEDMQFDLASGDTVSLQQLREIAAADPDGGLRCSASWLEGREAVNRTRCLVTVTRTGNLAIWESASGVTHCEASLKPKDYHTNINRLAEQLRELKDRRKNKIHSGDSLDAATAKLINTYAYCKHGGQNDVVPIYATSMDDGFPFAKLRVEMLPNSVLEPGPQGGRGTRINPADLWSLSDQRISVRGLRLRPDRERPVYEENGEKWINTYSAPDHSAEGGSAEGGRVLIEQLLPDAGERHYFTQWLAHKVMHPHVPGPAVLMVARKFGTGRGTLGVLIGKLLGQDYVTTLPFHMFAGKSYQSQYDDWGAETLMAIVTEASEAGEASRYTAKADTYTHVKSLVEPRATLRKFVSKAKHFKAWSFTSYLIATNDVDALPIPADDRRFAVLSNGDVADPEFFVEINRWMESPANVAAFHAYLMAYDLTGYSPFEAPPRTAAQLLMAELGRSPVDRCLDEALERLGVVFTVEQVIDTIAKIAATDGDLDIGDKPVWKRVVKREVAKRCYRVGVPNGINWHPLIEGKRVSVYAKTKALADAWKVHDRLREEVLKNFNGAARHVGQVLPFKKPD